MYMTDNKTPEPRTPDNKTVDTKADNKENAPLITTTDDEDLEQDNISTPTSTSADTAYSEVQETPVDPQKTTKGKNDDLPLCVMLNPLKSAMWVDLERSGLYLAQSKGATDNSGNPVKNWAQVPKTKDCSLIKRALKFGVLIPCKPGGISKLEPDPEFKGKIVDLMSKSTRELLVLIEQVRDTDLLVAMKTFEESRPKKERRPALLAAIARKYKFYGMMTPVKKSFNYISEKDGKVKDTIKIR
jgi:hypothetical protein